MTLGFAPWPYSELQLTTLISFILAVVFSSLREAHESATFFTGRLASDQVALPVDQTLTLTIHDRRNFHPVILSEATARFFRPAGFEGRAGPQSKDLLLPPFSMTLDMVKSRSLDSGQPAHQAKRCLMRPGWLSLETNMDIGSPMNNPSERPSPLPWTRWVFQRSPSFAIVQLRRVHRRRNP